MRATLYGSPAALGQARSTSRGIAIGGRPDSPLLEPAHVTAEAWVRRSGSPGVFAYVLSKGASGCQAASYALYSGFEGGMTFYVHDGSNYRLSSPDAGSAVWDGRWHHVAGTYDGSLVHLYVDGVQIGSGTPAPPIGYGLPSATPSTSATTAAPATAPSPVRSTTADLVRALSGAEIATLATPLTNSLPGGAPGAAVAPAPLRARASAS